MSMVRDSLALVGMPGSGKSTVGVVLAKLLGKDFVDTDLLIQQAEGRTLQQIVDGDGYLALRAIEARVICDLACRNTVIATGGSAPYSDPAMQHLRRHGPVVFLDVDLPTIARRIGDYCARGLAGPPGQTLGELFAERYPLYVRYADYTVAASALAQEEVAHRIAAYLTRAKSPS